MFLLCEEILQQMANVSSPFFQLCNKCWLSNPTRNTKRVILKYAIILCHNIFSPKPTGILLMNNVIQDKHKQRDIVIQFCNSLYEKTVLTIIKSVWYLKYAEIKHIIYLLPKQILYDFQVKISHIVLGCIVDKIN